MQLILVPYYASHKFKRWEKDVYKVGKIEYKDQLFDVGYTMGHIAAVFTIILLLSTAVPLLLPFGAIFFLTRFTVDKYNLIYVYPKNYQSYEGKSRHKLPIFLLVAVTLYLFIMGCIFISSTLHWSSYTIVFTFAVLGAMFILWFLKRPDRRLERKKRSRETILRDSLSVGKRLEGSTSRTRSNSSMFSRSSDSIEIPKDVAEKLQSIYHPCEKMFPTQRTAPRRRSKKTTPFYPLGDGATPENRKSGSFNETMGSRRNPLTP